METRICGPGRVVCFTLVRPDVPRHFKNGRGCGAAQCIHCTALHGAVQCIHCTALHCALLGARGGTGPPSSPHPHPKGSNLPALKTSGKCSPKILINLSFFTPGVMTREGKIPRVSVQHWPETNMSAIMNGVIKVFPLSDWS